MSVKSLAVKYRPTTFAEVVGQSSVKIILQNQLQTNSFKSAYLFTGGAGTGKTTCARIFANDINNGQGEPIELDAASNNGVDDARNLIQQAKTKSIGSEYKIFIIDECHALSNSAWQAMLKIIEEPPARSIFIFCTTDPQKIPKTIISRVQRYDFQRIAQDEIVNRLRTILELEGKVYKDKRVDEAITYIARLADGGMRDAITLMDKCLAFNKLLTLESVIKSLGTVNYSSMFELTDCFLGYDGLGKKEAIQLIEDIYNDGKELKTFVRNYVMFLIDLNKFSLGVDWKYMQIPKLAEFEEILESYKDDDWVRIDNLLTRFTALNAEIKWSQTVKYDIEAEILLYFSEVNK